MGKLAMSHWVVSTMAMFMGLGNFLAAQSSDAATNPWSRAIGEAKELHWETEDLQNRLNRLYPGSPAAQLSGALDESALALVEMVQKGADLYQLQMGLQTFKSIQVQLCQIASQDCRIHSDQTTVRYLKKVEDRYNYLVTDLSKCRLPTTSCPTHPIPTHSIPSYSNPWALPSPYPSSQPAIPPGLSVPPVAPFEGSQTPTTPTEVPHYWQGNLPPNNSFPGSTYDFEPHANSNRGTNPGYPTAVSSSRFTQNDHPPVAAEILSLLIQRASSR